MWYRSRPMNTSDFDYALPNSLIAQEPSAQRDASRLLVLDRKARTVGEDVFRNLPAYFDAGDCLALNDTRVIRARLRARKRSGGRVEIFLLKEIEPGLWESLVRPSARVKPGTVVLVGDSVSAIVEGDSKGRRRVRFSELDVLSVLEASGEIPLPPYIRRPDEDARDAARYQTVYAAHPGAVAAPTAGLHFTDAVFGALKEKGVARAAVTLHVGYGTFRPVQTERLEEHVIEAETFSLSESSAALLNRTRAEGRRVIAVGTTTTRLLETQHRDGAYCAGSGETKLCIYPGYGFRAVDALLTNFHLPRSSLLALVCAFGGKEFVLDAYRQAVEREFRFYSYGDAMLIL